MLSKFRRSRRRTKIIATLLVLVAFAAAGGAYAWFSSVGSGQSSTNVGLSAALTIDGNSGTTDLYPGGADVPVDVNVVNHNQGAEYVHQVDQNGPITTSDPGCLASDFSVVASTLPVTVNQDLAPLGGSWTVTGAFKLHMADSGINQDACQGATITVPLSSN